MNAATLESPALKPWRTLQARCLLARFNATLTEGDDGMPMLVVSRWALCTTFTDLAAAEAWVSRVEGRA